MMIGRCNNYWQFLALADVEEVPTVARAIHGSGLNDYVIGPISLRASCFERRFEIIQ